jgi:hypothetical protein
MLLEFEGALLEEQEQSEEPEVLLTLLTPLPLSCHP